MHPAKRWDPVSPLLMSLGPACVEAQGPRLATQCLGWQLIPALSYSASAVFVAGLKKQGPLQRVTDGS